MDALRHVHRLLVPGGTLVDMHPVTEEQVETQEGILGVIREPEWVLAELPNAEAALQTTIREGLYALETETEYEVLHHFDESDELIERSRDLLEEQEALMTAIRSAQPPLVTRMRVVFRRLRAV